ALTVASPSRASLLHVYMNLRAVFFHSPSRASGLTMPYTLVCATARVRVTQLCTTAQKCLYGQMRIILTLEL
ncbi:hypothetical protein HAX54_010392, partial [Datura stramonium]|nr:hypothetical protein [Datura stramonium]